jgi:hypothetical protein
MTPTEPVHSQPPEQQRYARLLDWGTRAGLLLLVASFVAYVSGLLPGVVPVDRLPELWSLPVAQFQARTQMPGGWGWLACWAMVMCWACWALPAGRRVDPVPAGLGADLRRARRKGLCRDLPAGSRRRGCWPLRAS